MTANRLADQAQDTDQGSEPYPIVHLDPRLVYEGAVQHGAKLGRTIGFPTANVAVPRPGPERGIYAARVRLADGSLCEAIAYFGSRPTVDGVGDLLEAYLFDFDGFLYGSELRVELVAFIRPDEQFAGLDEMVTQMRRDCVRARAVLRGEI
ncbi:MAG: riboflavin kinase [Caulobacteraceae bacterium]|nr:riboflavin kinase [Caulobacteraceae bacterium]